MPLPNYFEILKGSIEPRFRVAARLPAGMDKGGAEILPLDELMDRHRELAEPFHETPNPPIPEYFPSDELSLLELKALIAGRMLTECALCENRCGVDRTAGQRGKCGVGKDSYFASEFVHIGEEQEIIPSHTIFFTGCTLECIYCQNWDISHGAIVKRDGGFPVDDKLIHRILTRGPAVRNLNLVGGNPDQHLATILDLLVDLAALGYRRPIVWNSNIYGTPETIELLTGVADVHLADFKYGSNQCGEELSGIERYWDVVTRNLEAVKPVSDILIRQLVLPGHVECCTARIVDWVAENLPDARFNLMFQYHPEYRAGENPGINRSLTSGERVRANELASDAGLQTRD